MKKFISILVVLVFAVPLIFVWWPEGSNYSNSLLMATEACGLEKVRENWEYGEGRVLDSSFERESSEQREKMYSLSIKNGVLANRAALLDARWVPLAEAISRVSAGMGATVNGTPVGDYGPYLTDARIMVIYICEAIKEIRNS